MGLKGRQSLGVLGSLFLQRLLKDKIFHLNEASGLATANPSQAALSTKVLSVLNSQLTPGLCIDSHRGSGKNTVGLPKGALLLYKPN